jgi:hypothetical protein
MAQSKSTAVWDGEIGNVAKSVVMGCTTNATAETMWTAIEALSDAKPNSRSYSARIIETATPETGSNADLRGLAYFQDEDTGNVVRFTLVSPKSTAIETVPGREGGTRLTSACMIALQTAIQTATGKTLRVLYGVVVMRR